MNLEYAHKQERLKKGQKYLVAHAILEGVDIDFTFNVRKFYIPIIPHKHSDKQFGFPHEHYHLDGRFNSNDADILRFGLQNGKTNTIIVTEPFISSLYNFIGVTYIEKVCVRTRTGINPPKLAEVYNDWYNSYIGKSCAGKKCPHFGTQMITVNGKLYCPLHNIHADPKTLKVIPIPQ